MNSPSSPRGSRGAAEGVLFQEHFVSKSMSLDDLVALNDEIVGLVRSGVPLELGLAGWGRDLPGTLGRVVTELGDAGAQGRPLESLVADESRRFPSVYRAIVVAGIRAGRLPAALESVARSARNLREIRSAVALAVIYPLVLVLIGYGLFMFLAAYFIGSLSDLYEARPPALWTWIARAGSLVTAQIPIPGLPNAGIPVVVIPPLLLVVVAIVWWLRTRRGAMVDGGSAARWLAWIPVASRIARHSRWALLAEVFGVLVENGVPLDEALVLAADCTSDKRLTRSARAAADAIRAGAPASQYQVQLWAFPPLLSWLVCSGASQRTLAAMAAHIADTYRRRIARDQLWLRDLLPLWLVVVIGGVVVAAYAMSIFLPFSELLEHLDGANHGMRVTP
jgi:type II secretory pathway component PulF